MIALMTLQPVPCSGAEIDELLLRVKDNFATIQTLDLSVDIVHHPVDDGDDTGPVAVRRTWTSKGDKKRRGSYTDSYAYDGDASHPIALTAFDGETRRTVLFDAATPGKQVTNLIDPSPVSWDEVESKWIHLSECLRAWGMEINGYSLVEWLQSPVISIRSSTSGGLSGFLVEVLGTPDTPGAPGTGFKSEFFLAKEYDFALTEFSSYINDELSMTIMSTEFEEISDNVWFPITGVVIPGQRQKRAGLEPAAYEFHVDHVQANHEVPDSMFVPEFDPQVDVYTSLQQRARLEQSVMETELPDIELIDSATSDVQIQNPVPVSGSDQMTENAESSSGDERSTREQGVFSNIVALTVSLVIAFPLAVIAMRFWHRKNN